MQLVRDHERELQSYKLWLAAEIAGRSSHEAGYSGLARRNGAATPAIFIQSLTGQSLGDASKLAALGSLMVDDDKSPLTAAATAGAVSLAAADAIRRGLGVADDAVTETQLRAEAERLIAQASAVTPELLLRLARQSRAELDRAAVERGEKERASLRYVRRFRRDGMSGGSWLLPDEDGGLEIDTALRLLLAAQTGGPRFAEVDENLLDAGAALRDARTNEQVLADGFAQFFHIWRSISARAAQLLSSSTNMATS
ncbi:MAG: endonuclease [Glaciihabitans sp.]|nr:endonuclease [Glaciihabitans sp.]